MEIKAYKDLENKTIFFEFCREQTISSVQNAAVNMWRDDWVNHNYTLPYILENTDRFNGINGDFFILFDGNRIVACSGVYISEFNRDVAIAGVRTWVDIDYRHLSINRDYLLVQHKKWAVAHNLKAIALTFNDYNKNIIQIFKRHRLGETPGRITSREPYHLFYNGVSEVNFMVNVQHTPQWLIYEKLNNTFDFDWNIIKC